MATRKKLTLSTTVSLNDKSKEGKTRVEVKKKINTASIIKKRQATVSASEFSQNTISSVDAKNNSQKIKDNLGSISNISHQISKNQSEIIESKKQKVKDESIIKEKELADIAQSKTAEQLQSKTIETDEKKQHKEKTTVSSQPPDKSRNHKPLSQKKEEKSVEKRPPFQARKKGLKVYEVRSNTTDFRTSAFNRRRQYNKPRVRSVTQGVSREKIYREVRIPDVITVADLASQMSEKVSVVVGTLMTLGVMVNRNQSIDADTAEILVTELKHKPIRVSTVENIDKILNDSDLQDLPKKHRPPIVTIMGHVDHGKTSLIDALRNTDIISGEAGGITQHIGAYQISYKGQKITFLDTPGHAAFTQMRSRGAKVTDIVILIVDGTEEIKPQTIEAINHTKAFDVPIVLAINKMDLAGFDANNIKKQLLKYGVITEDNGGEIQSVEISAKNHTNIDKLMDKVILQADIMDITARYEGLAKGTVIESKLAKGRGHISTVIISEGTLNKKDIFVSGMFVGKVKDILNDGLKKINKAVPSMPVEIIGFNESVPAGSDFIVVKDENTANQLSMFRKSENIARQNVKTLNKDMFANLDKEVEEIPIILKADVQGSLEAINNAFANLSNDEVKIKVVHKAVGGVNESDVLLASGIGGIIVSFNIRAQPEARNKAKQSNVQIYYYSVIFNLVEDIKKLMSNKVKPKIREELLGVAEVLQVFKISGVGKVAGCKVISGFLRKGEGAKLIRDDVVIYDGSIEALKHHQGDLTDAMEGYECGVALKNFQNIKKGDKIESLKKTEIKIQF